VVPAADWLGHVDGGCGITALAIPGTHDTMTGECDLVYYKTQTLGLAEQLEIGVRFLDIRLRRTMIAAHREWVSTSSCADILGIARDFLAAHPGEFILMRVQNANEAKDDYDAYAAALKEQIREHVAMFHVWAPGTGPADNPAWPCLDEVRGKIVAIECSPPQLFVSSIDGARWAANWHANPLIRLQDDWDGPTFEAKQAAIETLMTEGESAPDVLRLNHISASNGEPGNPAAYAGRLNAFTDALLGDLARRNRESSATVAAGRATSLAFGRGVPIFDFVDQELAAATIAVNNLD